MENKVFSRRILPVKFREPVYYQFSSKNFKRKRPKNGPFLRIFLGILPVKYQYYQLSFKTTNVNYNNFVLALHIFIDLGLIKEVDNKFTIVKGVKNPINNSKLYNLVLNEV